MKSGEILVFFVQHAESNVNQSAPNRPNNEDCLSLSTPARLRQLIRGWKFWKRITEKKIIYVLEIVGKKSSIYQIQKKKTKNKWVHFRHYLSLSQHFCPQCYSTVRISLSFSAGKYKLLHNILLPFNIDQVELHSLLLFPFPSPPQASYCSAKPITTMIKYPIKSPQKSKTELPQLYKLASVQEAV